MKVCPKCNTMNYNKSIVCKNCMSDIEFISIVDNEYYDTYFEDLEELHNEKRRYQTKMKYARIIVPIYITVYVCLYIAAMLYSSYSKNIMTSCFVFVPLFGYIFIFRPNGFLNFITYFSRYTGSNKYYYYTLEHIRGKPLDVPEPYPFEIVVLKILGYILFLIALGLMLYFIIFKNIY